MAISHRTPANKFRCTARQGIKECARAAHGKNRKSIRTEPRHQAGNRSGKGGSSVAKPTGPDYTRRCQTVWLSVVPFGFALFGEL